eukprot:TRINITY_DN63645_c0_g2_i1.p1 TRINITY_DN63645_c0_g2~~TRINITY_DN63645_c0_g2_i1.p1  ORF type:complete len:244 (-),score=17.64 TRINITY_DN63645_c0_g2_i1:138-845(-)
MSDCATIASREQTSPWCIPPTKKYSKLPLLDRVWKRAITSGSPATPMYFAFVLSHDEEYIGLPEDEIHKRLVALSLRDRLLASDDVRASPWAQVEQEAAILANTQISLEEREWLVDQFADIFAQSRQTWEVWVGYKHSVATKCFGVEDPYKVRTLLFNAPPIKSVHRLRSKGPPTSEKNCMWGKLKHGRMLVAFDQLPPKCQRRLTRKTVPQHKPLFNFAKFFGDHRTHVRPYTA